MKTKKRQAACGPIYLPGSDSLCPSGDDRFRRLMDGMPDALFLWQPQHNAAGDIVDFTCHVANEAACRWIRLTLPQLLAVTLLQLWPQMKADGLFFKLCHVAATGEPLNLPTYVLKTALGSFIGGIYSISVVRVDDGISVCWRPVTHIVPSEDALLPTGDMLETILHNSWAAIIITAADDGRILAANQHACDLTGYGRDELAGHTVGDLCLYADGWAATMDILLREERLENFETSLRTKDGCLIPLLVSSVLVRLQDKRCRLDIGLDMTRQKEAGAKLQRLDRLNLVGDMAASIGHEVRNPMTTVRGYLQLFQRRPAFAHYGEQLSTMIDEIDKANAIITNFISLARNKIIDKQPGHLNDIVNNLAPIIQADAFTLGHDVRLELKPLPVSRFDAREIRQLILNISRNALEAMEERGLLTIRTEWHEETIVLTVQDTGPGIPAKVLQNIFQPFVTTKANGTGLGLPVCYRIAERHNAAIAISTTNAGTIFTITFPDESPATIPASPSASQSVTPPPRGKFSHERAASQPEYYTSGIVSKESPPIGVTIG